VLPKNGGDQVTRKSIKEYAEAIKYRYLKARKGEKTKILDEFTKTTGLHRKAVIRLLNRSNQPSAGKRRGRPKKYGRTLAEALKIVWEASDRLCSRRFHPFLKELLRILKQHREVKFTVEIETQLLELSPATIDRLLRPWRQSGKRRSFSTTRPGSLL
jgi:hypothetical protein